MPRLYSRTESGTRAWDAQSDRVPLDSRRVLGLTGKHTDPRDIGAKLGWSEASVTEILKDLEKGGMVKSVDAGTSASELDFTDSFNVADIQAAQQRMREGLDFTQPLSAEDLRAAREKR
jgi:DNA-binding Lrp family transcriptional regulator